MELPPAHFPSQNAPQILTMQPEGVGATASQPPRRGVGGIFKFLLLTILFLVFVGGGSVAALATYTSAGIPLLSDEQENAIKLALYRVPLLPKTPEQILLAASDSNTQLTTYTPDFSMSGTVGAASVSAASFDINVAGPVDFTPGKVPVFDLMLQGGVNFAGTSYEIAGKMRKVENLMYFKIDSLSDSILELATSYLSFGQNGTDEQKQTVDEIKQNLTTLFANWVSYDTGSIQSEARKALDARGGDQSLIESTRKKTNDLLLQQTIVAEIKKMPDEILNGVGTYHLQLIPSKDTMRKLLVESYPEDQRMTESATHNINRALDAISSLQIDVWFGKNDAILRKLSVQTSVKLDAYSQPFRSNMNSVLGTRSDIPLSLESITNPVINTSMVLLLNDIGKEVVIEVPKPVLSTQEYSTKMQDALKTEVQRTQDAVRTQFDRDTKNISSALLKYYVANGSYPISLSALIGQGLLLSDPAVKSLGDYTYRRSSSGVSYILYIEYQNIGFSQSSTPYYGITSEYVYPHQLDQEDFDGVR